VCALFSLSELFGFVALQCCHQFVGTLPSLSLSSSSRAGYKGGVKQRAAPVVRASNAEGPLRRPSAPGAAPSIATSPAPPSPPTSEPPPSPSPSQAASSSAAPAKVTPSKSTAVSIEYQRQRAKELQEYFLDKKYEEQVRADRIFGWTRKNEIVNGRYVNRSLSSRSSLRHCQKRLRVKNL
jgi:hypothetical protein